MYNEKDRVGLSHSRAIEKIALFYVAVLAGLLHRFPANFTQQTVGQIRNREFGGSTGAKASEQGEEITFANVAGVDEAKAELEEIVEFLWNPDKYIRLGARPPRGVLLELWNLQWLAGIAVYHVQMIREGAIPSEELHLEKSSWVVNCDWKFYSSHGS